MLSLTLKKLKTNLTAKENKKNSRIEGKDQIEAFEKIQGCCVGNLLAKFEQKIWNNVSLKVLKNYCEILDVEVKTNENMNRLLIITKMTNLVHAFKVFHFC
jgi:hypothetical protein